MAKKSKENSHLIPYSKPIDRDDATTLERLQRKV